MEIKINCPHCGQHYAIPETALGQTATCAKCGKEFAVKPEAAAAPKPEPKPAAPAKPTPKKSPELTNCCACGGIVHVRAAACPHCGRPMSPVPVKVAASGLGAGGVIQLLLLFFAFPIAVIASGVSPVALPIAVAIWMATLILCIK